MATHVENWEKSGNLKVVTGQGRVWENDFQEGSVSLNATSEGILGYKLDT